ncbi:MULTISPECIES: PA0069 family radical SAM protein [Pseudomonas]|uniref:PA0069 family radical SAM protein n=1 Tax=Pseudomonas proteolytica TaxID=219574 RepID=A0AAW5A935_9PSED|nr:MULTISPECIES: PA0069 family radical SAM protein [Pseudomonas]KAA8699821.1 PA0069 family radical SAM protein [Pseudomonas proteolytica]MCF5058939.1 PA0069 family radical SAM protein [Pseudomonas proteolytica]MCF5101718.1 PA0069 family radical SAM protein [Pseudomonas proteolytica]MDF3159364.1 PA0069 family radical SAM protein [Pseudomonas proteolytica]NMZ03257.1 PA0069 family radical SAM protein [Pseudomonas proteolytica]
MSTPLPPRGRGTATNLHNRFAPTVSVAEDDGWYQEVPPTQGTEVRIETAKTIITRNTSPDLPFDRSINPYRGCEHGCIYCYARPSHAYWDMSPGLDFETKLIAKSNAAEVLEQQLSKPGYVCAPINLGSNTDPYQPIEREYKITRQTLEVLLRYRHPVTIVTKGSLILRDLDLLTELARQRLVAVMISLTSLDDELKRILEPRAAAPKARLRAIRVMRQAGIPVGVLCSPMIPMINDSELESLLAEAHAAGAQSAAYMMLRLPLEVAPLFEEWLAAHYPQRAAHVMSLVRQVRGGEVYDSRFGVRMRGEGPFADLLAQRFAKAIKRLGLDRREGFNLDCSAFCPPGRQLALL